MSLMVAYARAAGRSGSRRSRAAGSREARHEIRLTVAEGVADGTQMRMVERNRPRLETVDGASRPWVRIPPPPLNQAVSGSTMQVCAGHVTTPADPPSVPRWSAESGGLLRDYYGTPSPGPV